MPGLTPTTLFEDDFEEGLDQWTTDWHWTGYRYYSGAYSVCGEAYDNDLTSDPVDARGYSKMTVSFMYFVKNVNTSDNVYVQYYDGSDYVSVEEIGDDAQNVWLNYRHAF